MKQNLFLDVGVEKIEPKTIVEEKKNAFFKTSHYFISKENKKRLKKEEGDYFIITFSYDNLILKQNLLAKEVERILKTFLKKYQKSRTILVVGLGNKNVLADALGVNTTDKLIATNQYQDFLTIPKIALFNPSVIEKTGISSFKLIEMVVKDLKPDIILMVDSLLTKENSYLNQAIEINDTGIIPGVALNSAKEINKKTFRIPVISIGVPCVLKKNKTYYTTTTIQEVIDASSNIISSSIHHLFIK